MSADIENGPAAEDLAPIDYLAIEFPGGRVTSKGFDRLRALSEQGVIQILDTEFIVKDTAGDARIAEVSELDGGSLTDWDGASSGLLDTDDVDQIGSAIQPGSAAVVVVYENRWVLGLVNDWLHEGARLIADGGLEADDIVAALNQTE
jgi:hypothetical protein